MNIIRTSTRTTARVTLFAAAAAFALAGCTAAAETPPAAPAADTVTVVDAWAKAADGGMTGAFGTFANDSELDATLVAAESDAAGMVELHEVIVDENGQTVMREIEGGFLIPGGGSRVLEPGADHLMLMGLAAPLRAGEQVTLDLTFSDGSTTSITVPVKDFAGANESYDDGHGGEHGEHMDGHDQ